MADPLTAAESTTLLRLLTVATYQLFKATLVGHPAPAVAALYETLTHPQPGDVVMEYSTVWDAQRDAERFGRLIIQREEVIPYANEAEAALNDHEVRWEVVVYIERLDGHLSRWHNSEFIRVLETAGNSHESAHAASWAQEARQRHGLLGKEERDAHRPTP